MNGGQENRNGMTTNMLSGNEQDENDAQKLDRGCCILKFWQALHERRR